MFYRADDPGTEYELFKYGNFQVVERLMPGCFDRAINEDDVRATFNHDPSLLLGRSKSGTLRLFADGKGLRYEIDPPDTHTAHDLMESLQRGDVTGSSFSFDYLARNNVEQFLPDGVEKEIIEVCDVTLYDVGPVTFPAYVSTTAEARKANGGYWTPERRRRRVEEIERELAELDKRLAANAPRRSRRTRRERIRERCNRVIAEVERDAIAQLELEIEELRQRKIAGLAQRQYRFV